MPGDTDISHAVEARLSAIEERLDALDGGEKDEDDIDEIITPKKASK